MTQPLCTMIGRPRVRGHVWLTLSAAALTAWCLQFGARPSTARAGEDIDNRLGQLQLLFCFQGKGSCLPYDAGVLHEAYARIPAMRQQRTIVAGNSSGSIPAAYFGCFGLSDTAVRYAEYRLVFGDKEAVRNMEDPRRKAANLLRGRPTEIPHLELREYIAFALGVEHWRQDASIDQIVRQSRAYPRHPTLIVACNKEVLEDRDPHDSMASRGYKEIDPETLTVSWRPDVYEFYRAHPQQFAREHPDLDLGPDRRIGKAMTFFVDASLYQLLRRLPADECTADLRLMDSPADVALAILASTSEPTYFYPVTDSDPGKLLVRYDGRVRRRTYYGGYIVPMPAQDVRRSLPGIRVLGTGWRHNPMIARQLLAAWLLADVEAIAHRCEWWSDMEVIPGVEFQSHMVFRDLTSRQEFEFGKRQAQECFAGVGGIPQFAVPSKLDFAADGAIWPAAAADREGAPKRTARWTTHPADAPRACPFDRAAGGWPALARRPTTARRRFRRQRPVMKGTSVCQDTPAARLASRCCGQGSSAVG